MDALFTLYEPYRRTIIIPKIKWVEEIWSYDDFNGDKEVEIFTFDINYDGSIISFKFTNKEPIERLRNNILIAISKWYQK